MATTHPQSRKPGSEPLAPVLGVLLACFAAPGGAAHAHRAIDARLRADGTTVLGTTVLKVNAKGKASLHDPRRVLLGTLTAGLTWGLFGLVANGWVGLAIWAVLGAICGGLFTRLSAHHASKAELAHIGARLPSGSSALLLFAEVADPRGLLAAAGAAGPRVASAAAIDAELGARVELGDGATAPAAGHADIVTMLLLRYSTPGAAKKITKRVDGAKSKDGPEIELVIETDADGHRRVTDPKFGPAAWSRSDLVSWGLFGVVVGAISGASGGGILKGGAVTGVAWAIFGVFAGSLYGLWGGRSASARRLKGIGPLLAAGTSELLVWVDGSAEPSTLERFAEPGSQALALRFVPAEGGAVLAVA